MELFKIVLPCLAILSISVRVNSMSVDIPKTSNHDKDCFCIPRNSQNIKASEYISRNGEPHRRLIIYLYKNDENNVTIYVPGKEKQSVLPDLTIDDGDRLDHINAPENVDQLFNIYPGISIPVREVRRPNLVYNPSNIVDHADSIEIIEVDPTFQVDLDKIINLRPNKKTQRPLDEQSSGINDYLNYLENTNAVPEKHTVHSLPDNSEIKNILRPQGIDGNVPHVLKHTSVSIPKNMKIPQDVNLNLIESGKDSQSPLQIINNHYSIWNEEDLQAEGMDVITHPDVDTDKQNQILAPEQNNIHGPIIIKKLPEKYRNKKISPSYISGHISMPHSKLYPKEIILLPHQSLILNEPQTSQALIHPKYKKWFWEQVRLLEIKRPSIKHINSGKLLTLVIETLNQNGIKISNTGDLQEANGNIIPLMGVQLRPILLADPVEQNKIVGANKCYIPYDAPYWETILVTSMYPPRTLAVVPIAKSNFSQNLYYVNSDCKLGSCEHTPCCKKWPCHKPATNAYLDNTSEPPKTIMKLIKEPFMNIKPNIHGLFSFIKPRRMNDDDTGDKATTESTENIEPELEELPTDLEEEVQEVTENVEQIKNIEDEDDKDSLGIRIIGGTPAVSSGMPVNIKGRIGMTS